MMVIPIVPLKISLIYTRYFTFKFYYCVEYFVGFEDLTDSYYIPSKISANKTLVFKASAFWHPFKMVVIVSLRNPHNKD